MSTQPTYRAVLAVMLTDPEAEWQSLDILEHLTMRPKRLLWTLLGQMIDLGWVEVHGGKDVFEQTTYRLTDRGRKRAAELVTRPQRPVRPSQQASGALPDSTPPLPATRPPRALRTPQGA